jgi:hypothetical protein
MRVQPHLHNAHFAKSTSSVQPNPLEKENMTYAVEPIGGQCTESLRVHRARNIRQRGAPVLACMIARIVLLRSDGLALSLATTAAAELPRQYPLI